MDYIWQFDIVTNIAIISSILIIISTIHQSLFWFFILGLARGVGFSAILLLGIYYHFLSECKVAVRWIKTLKTSKPSSKNVPLPHPDKNNPEALSQLYKMMNYKPTSNKG